MRIVNVLFKGAILRSGSKFVFLELRCPLKRAVPKAANLVPRDFSLSWGWGGAHPKLREKALGTRLESEA